MVAKMKNTYYITIVLTLLSIGCKESKKTENVVDQQVAAVNHSWTDKQQEGFLKNCNGFLISDGVDNAEEYCDCLLTTTMDAYPNPEIAMELEQNDIVRLFEESGCLDDYLMVKIEDPWTDEVNEAYLKSCIDARIKTGVSKEEAVSYCSCSLDYIKEIIPNPQHLIQLTKEEWEKIKSNCN